MPNSDTQKLDLQSVQDVARNYAGHPIADNEADEISEGVRAFMQHWQLLRNLPLKEVEPAVQFSPTETDDE